MNQDILVKMLWRKLYFDVSDFIALQQNRVC